MIVVAYGGLAKIDFKSKQDGSTKENSNPGLCLWTIVDPIVSTQSCITLMMAVVTAETCQLLTSQVSSFC